MSRRTERINDLLRDEISELLSRELKDERLEGWLISITGVEVSPDLSHARVFASLLGPNGADRQPVMAALASASPYLRRELGHRLNLRRVPELRFRLDESIERGVRLSQLIDDLASGP